MGLTSYVPGCCDLSQTEIGHPDFNSVVCSYFRVRAIANSGGFSAHLEMTVEVRADGLMGLGLQEDFPAAFTLFCLLILSYSSMIRGKSDRIPPFQILK